jgi:hypothetical protein
MDIAVAGVPEVDNSNSKFLGLILPAPQLIQIGVK